MVAINKSDLGGYTKSYATLDVENSSCRTSQTL